MLHLATDDPYSAAAQQTRPKAAVGRFVSLSYVPLRSALVQEQFFFSRRR
jgi:hypothetical protein